MLKKIIFSLLAFVIFLFCLNATLSFTDLDLRLMMKIFSYQYADLEVHKVSNDAGRLYELIPGARFEYPVWRSIHPQETKKFTKKIVTINGLGFRDRERRKTKQENVIRIVFLGASNTYGASVSDEDTYPALLQKIFDEKYPGKVEVWNGGINAYQISQEAAYAEYIVKNFAPDILVFQDYMIGRRMFLWGTSLKEIRSLFRKNRELYVENTPLFCRRPGRGLIKAHYFFATYSPLYRICCTGIAVWLRAYDYARGEEYRYLWDAYGQMVNNRDFGRFAERHKEIPIILFSSFNESHCVENEALKDNVAFFALNNHGKPKEYTSVHPPSYVYQWYADNLFDFLTKNGYLNGR